MKKRHYKPKGELLNIKAPKAQFFKLFFKSFNPGAYGELAETLFSITIKYFFQLLLISLLLGLIVAVPKLMIMPATLSSYFSHFSKFDANLEVEMKSPLFIPAKNPDVVVDLDSNASEVTQGRVLVTESYMLIKKPFDTKRFEFESWSDVLAHKENISKALSVILVLMLPSLFFIFFILLSIKYLLIILIATIIAFIISRLTKFEIDFGEIFKVGIYASTLFIIIELITKPIVNLSFVPIIPFIVYFVLGVIEAGSFSYTEKAKRKRQHKKKKKESEFVSVEDAE